MRGVRACMLAPKRRAMHLGPTLSPMTPTTFNRQGGQTAWLVMARSQRRQLMLEEYQRDPIAWQQAEWPNRMASRDLQAEMSAYA